MDGRAAPHAGGALRLRGPRRDTPVDAHRLDRARALSTIVEPADTPSEGHPIRWGILGTAGIARAAVAPAIHASRHGTLLAVASRSAQSSERFAADLGIERTYGSYDALLTDPDVEAVYIPLPNALHAPWTIRAAEAGKHVLCEKPLALSAAECRVMQSAAELHGVRLVEAFMYRYHPRTVRAIEHVRSGSLGPLRTIRSTFSFVVRRADDIRLDAALGGGALMDVGCYCVNVTLAMAGRSPRTVQAVSIRHPGGVDRSLAATLAFDDDLVAQFTCSLDAARTESFEVIGRDGRLEASQAFLPGAATTRALWTAGDGTTTPFEFAGVDQYALMIDHVADVVRRGEAPRTGAEDAARTLQVIEALHASARDGGRPVTLQRARVTSGSVGSATIHEGGA